MASQHLQEVLLSLQFHVTPDVRCLAPGRRMGVLVQENPNAEGKL